MGVFINFHIEFDNIHVIYLFTCRLLSSKSNHIRFIFGGQ